jgi:AAA+ ATPase superfamily predicted ATPase
MRKSPFKFLDAYQKDNIDIFFGREKETEALYNALSGVKHLLVYGPLGAGKTSLIECGLSNQFSDADWFALTFRKGSNITGSFFSTINTALEEKIPLNTQNLPIDHSIQFEDAIEQLFAERYQSVYLLFDQFEELLISGSEAEQKIFLLALTNSFAIVFHVVYYSLCEKSSLVIYLSLNHYVPLFLNIVFDWRKCQNFLNILPFLIVEIINN